MEIERPGSVPAAATYDVGSGQWRERVTDGDGTVEREWHSSGELYILRTLEGGVRTKVRHFHRNGRLAYEWLYRDGVEVSRRAWYEDGSPYYQEEFEAGVRTRSIRHYPDGVVESQTVDGCTRTFFPSAAMKSERVDDRTTWFADDGSVVATEEPHRRIADAYLRREHGSGGRLLAEGYVDHSDWGARGAVGEWRLFDSDGAVRGEVHFGPIAFPPKEAVADTAEVLLAWQSLPKANYLAEVEAVAWARQKVYFGLPESLPFHLNGLSSPREDVFDLALRNLSNALFHQGTLAGAVRRVAPFLVAAGASLDGEHRDRVVELLVGMLSGGDFLDSAEDGLRAGKSTTVGALRAEVAARIDRWRQLAGDGDAWAALLLPFAAGRANGQIVLSTVQDVVDPAVRARLTLGLALCRPAGDTVPWLRDQLRDDDRRQRFCGALALARLGDPAGVDVLIDAVTTAPPGCAELFWIPDSAQAACAALGRIDDGLPMLLSAFVPASAVRAIGIARALIHRTFRERPDRLTDEQGQVLRAIANHPTAWDGTDLTSLLRDWSLPTDRDALSHLAESDPDSSTT